MQIIMKILAFFMSLSLTVTGWFGLLPKHTLLADTGAVYQTNEGFGTSSAWWAQTIGDEETAREIAKRLYDKKEGLGLDVFRFNVGAGEKENPDSIVAIDTRKTESFYYYNETTGAYEYDFSRDANAVRMMRLAVEYGATKVILFCNSPHFSMTANGRASGSSEEGVCNLPQENYGAFADYLLTIADHFVAEGLPIYGVSPINEPQWDWGTGWVSQEGCHYSPEEAVKLLETFALKMQERNAPYKLLGPESGDMDENNAVYERAFYSSEILREFCDTYSGHSYWLDGNYWQKSACRERFANDYPGLKFEMSEWCELPQTLDPTTIESGMRMANVIYEDLTLLNAVSWQSWTAVNGDGLLDFADGALVQYKRYPVFRQFSLIPAGAVRVGTLDSHLEKTTLKTLAYTKEGTIWYVVINDTDQAESLKIGGVYTHLTVYQTDADSDFETIFNGALHKTVELPAHSVTTFVAAR